VNHTPRLYLSTDPTVGHRPVRAQGLVLDKDVLRVGTYKHPVNGWTLDVTHDYLDRLVSTFNLMRQNGVTSDITVDHSTSARDKLGSVTQARRDGDRLILRHEFADEECVKIADRNQEVSVEIEPEMDDGKGNTYRDALVASSIVRQPVVPNQGPFVRIAASLGASEDANAGTAAGLPFRLTAESHTDPRDNPTKEHDMKLTIDQRKKVFSLTGLDDKAPEAELATGLIDMAGKGKAADDQTQQITDLTSERDKLALKIESLKKGKAPEADPDVMEETAENRRDEIDGLVAKGNITPAVGEKLAASLLGEPGKRPALCLSRKAATHAGLPGPIAKTVIDILKENDPVKLKEQTGPQTMSLGRQTPGAEDTEDKGLDASIKAHNEGVGSGAVNL